MSKPLPDQSEPRELLCQRCGHDYEVWSAPNDLWNAVVRDGLTRGGEDVEVARGEHFLCPTCFTVLAHEREAVPLHTIWNLDVDRVA